MVLADFSKRSIQLTIKLCYTRCMLKFSNSSLKWFLNYRDNRHHFVQVNDKMLEVMLTRYG